MEISRLNAGVIMLVTGVVCNIAYFWVNTTSAGPISELLGAGFLFTFMGALCLLGEAVGVAPSDDK